MASRARHTLLTCALAAALAVGCALVCPARAHATTLAEVSEQIAENNAALEEANVQLEEANERLEEAQARVDEIQAQIDENEARIAEIEALLPDQREKAANSLVTLYKLSQDMPGLVDLVLSSENFYELLATLTYLDIIQTRNNDAVDQLVELDRELDATHALLSEQMAEAEARRQEAADAQQAAEEAQQAAEQALAESIALREELEIEAARQAAAEEAARQAAILEAQQAAAAAETFTTESGEEVVVTVVPTTTGLSPVDWSVGEEEFIASWGARIDAYLAGSPLAGYGTTFAAAAWANGVDPRLSPAIAATESSKGAVCFRSYNAWGWGQYSWSDWETAIWGHVGGLASAGYYTITLAGAYRYCPPNASRWYAVTLAQMQMI